MTEDTSGEVQRRLRIAAESVRSSVGELDAWDDAASTRIRPDVDGVAGSLEAITGRSTELMRHCDDATRLAGLARTHGEAATECLAGAEASLEAASSALAEAETGLRNGEQAARDSGHLVTQALRELSMAGAPCGLSSGVGALEGEVAGGVRDVRLARARRMVAKAAARAVAVEAAWDAAEHLAGAGAEKLTGLDDVQFGDAWGTLRTTAEDFAPLTTARIRAWLDGLRSE